MRLTDHKLGNFVELYSERCGISNLTIYDISGVNADKEFFEPSKQVGTDTSSYKVVPPGYFACNLMHVGRDAVLPIALNHTEKKKIVSPAYTVFKIKAGTSLLCNYFFMMLKCPERDRYFWFHTDSSVRDGMSWEDFCDLEVKLPPLEIQKKYVEIYDAVLSNQRSYEHGLEDLKLVCEAEIDKIKHTAAKVVLGDLVQDEDKRNINGDIISVHGVNKDKQFMPSVASGADLTKYKVVSKNQFACNLMHVGRDKAVPVALQKSENNIIVSPAYFVFSISAENVLPEYVLMWLSRGETDRYAWFMSDTNVRSGMERKRFLEIEIPVPSENVQHSLVELHNALSMRREINERLKTQIKNLCPILIKGSIEEAVRT